MKTAPPPLSPPFISRLWLVLLLTSSLGGLVRSDRCDGLPCDSRPRPPAAPPWALAWARLASAPFKRCGRGYLGYLSEVRAPSPSASWATTGGCRCGAMRKESNPSPYSLIKLRVFMFQEGWPSRSFPSSRCSPRRYACAAPAPGTGPSRRCAATC